MSGLKPSIVDLIFIWFPKTRLAWLFLTLCRQCERLNWIEATYYMEIGWYCRVENTEQPTPLQSFWGGGAFRQKIFLVHERSCQPGIKEPKLGGSVSRFKFQWIETTSCKSKHATDCEDLKLTISQDTKFGLKSDFCGNIRTVASLCSETTRTALHYAATPVIRIK